jgi:RHS repeat-associated protein
VNRLSSVSDAHLGCCATYGYDAAGRIQSLANPNGINNTCQYDSLNHLTNITALNSQSALVAEYTYTYSAAGRRLTAAENIATTNGVRTINRLYTYDANYRLTGESIAATGPVSLPGNSSIGYTYDHMGNRLSRVSTLSQVPTASYNYDVDDRLTSDSYDNNGNTVSGHVLANQASVSDQYDFENRLINRNNGQVTLAYDADGNRMSKTVNGVTTLYLVDDGIPSGYAQVLEEYTSVNSQSPALNKVYTYGMRLIAQDQLIGGQWTPSFYGYDGHGNVRYLTDAAGNLTDTYDYDAFGKLIAQSSVFVTPTPNAYLFAGEQFDADLGVYYNRARYLNTDSGRFWTRDPLLNRTIQVLHFPSYDYVLNDPVNQADRSGQLLDEELIAMQIGERMDVNMALRNVKIWIEYSRVLIHKSQPAAKKRQVALDAIAMGASDWAYDQYSQADEDFAFSLQEITKIYIKQAWATLKGEWAAQAKAAEDEMENAFNNTGADTPQNYYSGSSGWPCCGPSYNAPGLPNHDPEIDTESYQDVLIELGKEYYKLGHLGDDDKEVDETLEKFDKAYEAWKKLQEALNKAD